MYFSEKIARKIAIIERALAYLKSRADVRPEDVERNYELKSALERNFQVAIEAALDIGEMIIAEEGLERPEEYRDVFLELGKAGIIPNDFASRIAPMAGFRNILVHQYDEVNVKLMCKFLREKLGDLEEFISYVRKYLRKKEA